MTPELIGAAVAGALIVIGAVAKVAFSRGHRAASGGDCGARDAGDGVRQKVESEHAETRALIATLHSGTKELVREMDRRHAATMAELIRIEHEQNRLLGGVLEQVRAIASDAQAAAREARAATDELRRVAARIAS